MSNFEKMDGSEFESQYHDLIFIQGCLEDAYNVSNELQGQIRGNDWEGKAKNEMLAYLDLLKQYQGALIGKTNGSNPVQEGVDALKQLMDHLDSFYSECGVFRELEKL